MTALVYGQGTPERRNELRDLLVKRYGLSQEDIALRTGSSDPLWNRLITESLRSMVVR